VKHSSRTSSEHRHKLAGYAGLVESAVTSLFSYCRRIRAVGCVLRTCRLVVLSDTQHDSMRTTKTVSISMPPAELKIAERLAKSTNRSISGVLREGLKRLASEQYWQHVDAYAKPKADALGITENDVNRLVGEYRREKRGKTTKKQPR